MIIHNSSESLFYYLTCEWWSGVQYSRNRTFVQIGYNGKSTTLVIWRHVQYSTVHPRNILTFHASLSYVVAVIFPMVTSSNGNIFRVTGPLCGEFTGPGEFPTQRPVTRSFDVFFDLRLNKRLSKQPWGWWFETPSWSLWRQCNAIPFSVISTALWQPHTCPIMRICHYHGLML